MCKKFYKPVTRVLYSQLCDCLICVPRVTLLDLQANWAYDYALEMELIHI